MQPAYKYNSQGQQMWNQRQTKHQVANEDTYGNTTKFHMFPKYSCITQPN